MVFCFKLALLKTQQLKKIVLILFTLGLVSCFEKEQEKGNVAAKNQYILQNSITVLIPNSLWNGKIGEKIREKFAAPIEGLHECESVFTLLPVHSNNLPEEAKAARNILVIDFNFEKQIAHETNKFHQNQHIFTIKGRNEEMVLRQIQLSCNEILNTFYQSEIDLVLQNTKTDVKLQKQIKRQFAIAIQMPTDYKKGLQGENFLWVRKEIGSGYNNILIYTASFSALYNKNPFITNSLSIRNQVSKKYVLGKTKGSYMIVEPAYYPSFQKTRINDKLTYEMRGSWEFHKDFMTGPYVNFAIKDSKRKRFIFIDGFAYNPIHSKKDLLFEMEAIIKSTKIL